MILAILAASFAVSSQPAGAAVVEGCAPPSGDGWTTSALADRAARVNETIAHELQAGASQGKVDARLMSLGVVNRSGQPAGVEADGPVTINASSPASISVPSPSILYDTCVHRWHVYAPWHWLGTDGLVNEGSPPSCTFCNLGGRDGFGIALSRSVSSVSGYFVTTWGNPQPATYYTANQSRMNPTDANTYGVSFAGQDQLCKGCSSAGRDYNFYNGELFYNISSIGCGTIQAFSKYGHTWSSTGINGIGVGPWSLSFQWSSEGSDWLKASQPSNAVTPC